MWASIRDYLTPLDVLATRTAGLKWNCAKLYGEFAALWFFLMTKDGSEEGAQPEWPSLCLDHRQNFGFDHGMFDAGWILDMPGALRNARVDAGEWREQYKKALVTRAGMRRRYTVAGNRRSEGTTRDAWIPTSPDARENHLCGPILLDEPM